MVTPKIMLNFFSVAVGEERDAFMQEAANLLDAPGPGIMKRAGYSGPLYEASVP
jgi:hypothetical protein